MARSIGKIHKKAFAVLTGRTLMGKAFDRRSAQKDTVKPLDPKVQALQDRVEDRRRRAAARTTIDGADTLD